MFDDPFMTAPRQIFRGSTYLFTHRCFDRAFFLVPDERVREIFLYVLAVAAGRYNIMIHAVTVMSNHWHAILTDVEGKLPRFAQDVHSMVARAINAHRGRWEGFWSVSQRYSAVRLLTVNDAIDKMVYVLANPVRAGLVAKGEQWPGLILNPAVGTEHDASRPVHFFRQDNRRLPQTATLKLAPLPGIDESDLREMQRRLLEAEHDIREEFRSEGKRFMGRRKVMEQRWYRRARGAERRRRLNPHIACRDKELRIAALRARQDFIAQHERARRKWTSGSRRVVFPEGTYMMRVNYGVRCQSQGP